MPAMPSCQGVFRDMRGKTSKYIGPMRTRIVGLTAATLFLTGFYAWYGFATLIELELMFFSGVPTDLPKDPLFRQQGSGAKLLKSIPNLNDRCG